MGWFDTKELSAQAQALAAEYARVRSGAIATGASPDQLRRRYDKVGASAMAYAGGLGLNLYKKSRFFQALRASLLEQSVPEAEAEVFVRGVIVGPLAAARSGGADGRGR